MFMNSERQDERQSGAKNLEKTISVAMRSRFRQERIRSGFLEDQSYRQSESNPAP